MAATKLEEVGRIIEDDAPDHEADIIEALDDDVGDDLLRLIFTSCHPILPAESRVALTLRLLGGLTTEEIARAFLAAEPTIGQRIVRAKKTIADAGIPFEVPRGAEREDAKVVSTKETYQWNDGSIWRESARTPLKAQQRLHVVAYDYGIKRNILRLLADVGCRITVVPAQTPAAEVMALGPDGVFLSNGPGDPEPCDYAITAIREILQTDMPVFGICLGHQLLGLAAGARTMKMKFGHHGANHPVQDLTTRRVAITSQNHGFAVDPETLPANVRTTHVSLFDGSLQGIELTDKPAFSFQGHPEASPGPHDLTPLFERFVQLMVRRLQNQLRERRNPSATNGGGR